MKKLLHLLKKKKQIPYPKPENKKRKILTFNWEKKFFGY